MKRSGYISWDEYFMGVSLLAAKRSKDPNTQVGACIVDSNNIILSTGYNGFPYGCSDDLYPWEREGEDTKYNYVVHAELNAILNARGKDLKGARLYVDLFPCNECAKAIHHRQGQHHTGFQKIVNYGSRITRYPKYSPFPHGDG